MKKRLETLIELERKLSRTMQALEASLGVESYGNDSIFYDILSFLQHEIAEYSNDYSVFRWEDGAIDWFPEYIVDILDEDVPIKETAEKIKRGTDEIGLPTSANVKIYKDIVKAQEDLVRYQKTLNSAEDINPISDYAREIADRIESKKIYISTLTQVLMNDLNEGDKETVSRLLRRSKRWAKRNIGSLNDVIDR